MKICPSCKATMSDAYSFCSYCGAQINQPGTPNQIVTGQPVQPGANLAQPAPPVMANATVPSATNSMQNSGNSSRSLNVFAVVSASVFIISIFLPYVSVSLLGARAEKSLMDGGDGVFFIAIGAVMLLFSLIKREVPSLIFGIIATGLVFFESYYTFHLSDYKYKELLSKEMGYYLLLFSSLAFVVACIYGIVKRQKGR